MTKEIFLLDEDVLEESKSIKVNTILSVKYCKKNINFNLIFFLQ